MALNDVSPDLAMLQQDNAVPPDNNTQAVDETETGETDDEQSESDEEEEIEDLLLEVVHHLEKEDEELRYPLLREWRRNDLYFNDVMKIFYDATAKDYRTFESAVSEMQKYAPTDDIKTVNVYRAYAESLISALAIATPKVEFVPDDVDDPDDIQTADVFTKIAYLIEQHNEAPLMLIKALTILFNQGVVAANNSYRQDPSYGIIETPGETKQVAKQTMDARCRRCGEMIDSGLPSTMVAESSSLECPSCQYVGAPQLYAHEQFIDEVVSWENTPKGRSIFDVYGPTSVKLPLYAKTQDAIGYLELREEDHYAKYRAEYKDDEISTGSGDTYLFERWCRIPIEYAGTLPLDIQTKRTAWIRPWYFNILDADDAKKLTDKYPNGVKVVVIEDEIYEKVSEKLDDVWTISFDPRNQFIHGKPAGNSLVPLQDAKTDMFNLGLQSIEYGIPETFANPKTLSFKKYNSTPAAPGNMSPALPPSPGQSLADGFFTLKTATLSNEYIEFDKGLDGLTQFVTGAFPSIFGGSSNVGSKTAAEYKESKARALQRLQLTWQSISSFYTKIVYKCTRDYAKNVKEDESYAKKQNGTYVNIWIMKSALSGKVGHINPESNEQLPQSWEQKKDFFMSLLGLQVPEIAPMILHPNNSELIKQVTGMPEFYIPGEHDRNKQFSEYYLLAQQQPNGHEPTVDIDIDVDDHQIHMLVLKNILVSPVGLNLYQTNPAAYQNCIAHYRKHEMALQAKTISPAGGSGPDQTPPSATSTTQG